MKITIDTTEALSPADISILEMVIGHSTRTEAADYPVVVNTGSWEDDTKAKAPAKTKPKNAPAKPKAEPTPDEEPDEFASDEAVKETKAPAKAKPKKAEPEETPERSLEDLLTEASELATEIMNQGGKAKIKAALKTVGAPKVSAIDDAGQAAEFLDALKAED